MSLPASVTVAAGATNGAFTLGVGAISGNPTVTITGSANGTSAGTSLLLGSAAVTVSSVQCSAPNVPAWSGVGCTVTISKGAPAGGTVVTVSGAPSVSGLSVPASLTIPAGANYSFFDIGSSAVASGQTVTITVSLNGSSAKTTLVTGSSTAGASATTSGPSISSLSCSTPNVPAWSGVSCTVTISAAAPGGGALVTVSGAPSVSGLSVPASLTIPAGANYSFFDIGSSALASGQTVTITVSLNGSSAKTTLVTGSSTAGASATTSGPSISSLSCSGPNVPAWSGVSCTVTISAAAPGGGAPVTVSGAPSVSGLSVPASLTIPAGANYSFFDIGSSALASGQTVTITVSLNGSSAKTTLVTGSSTATTAKARPAVSASADSVPALANGALSCAQKALSAGATMDCTVELDSPGASAGLTLQVASTSADLGVPALVTPRPGQRVVRFEVTASQAAAGPDVMLTVHAGASALQTRLGISSAPAPALHAPRQVFGRPGVPLRFNVQAESGLPVSLSATNLPDGATFDAETGAFEWPAPAETAAHYDVAFTAAAAGGTASAPTRITIESGLPKITGLENIAGPSAAAACSPGAPASLAGRFLATAAIPVSASAEDSSELAGTRVLVNGSYATLLYVSDSLVDFVCPASPAGTPLEISLETPAGRSNTIASTMKSSAPGILTVSHGDTHNAVAFAENSSDPAAIPNPDIKGQPSAPGGLLTVLVTGISCDPAGSSQMPQFQFDGQVGALQSLAPVEASGGICQATLQAPAALPSGTVPLVLQVSTPEGKVVSNTASVAIEN